MLFVKWAPIQSANVRYIQVSVKNKQNTFRSDILENHFYALPSVSPKKLRVAKKKHSGELQDVNNFLVRTIVSFL